MKKKRGECDCCGCMVKVAKYDPMRDGSEYWFCDVCAGTFASKAMYDHSMSSEARMILRTLGGIGNMILEAINKKGRRS